MEVVEKPYLTGLVLALGAGGSVLAYKSTSISLHVAALGVVFTAFLAASVQ